MDCLQIGKYYRLAYMESSVIRQPETLSRAKAHSAFIGYRKYKAKSRFVFNVVGKTGGRVTFPELISTLRNDESFRLQRQPRQHNSKA